QSIVFLLVLSALAGAQTPLQQLRDQLVATNGWREHDVVAVISERALNDTAQRMAGLEIKLNNGVTMKLNSVALELKPAVAQVKLGVEVNPSSKFKAAKFRLFGKLGSGEINGANLRLPFQLTDVAFGSEDSASLSLLKLLLREWLAPEKWNDVLPPLEVPLQLNPTIDIPAATFESNGEMPMTIATPAYQLKLDFTLAALAILDGRAVVALNLQPKPAPPPATTNSTEDEATLLNEIGRLTQHLALNHDLRMRVRKNAINEMLAKLAAAREIDLTVKLKQGRIRAEEIDALLGRILNYTDVESGDGKADVARLLVEDISATRVFVRLTGQGDLNAKVKGREYGIPYNVSPRGRFTINNEMLPLEILSRNDRIIVRAAAGASVPVRVNLTIDVIGQPVSLTRTVNLRADEWLKDFELPALLTQEIELPRQLALDKENKMTIIRREPSRYTIANLRVETKDEALEVLADVR
ncbi:MAG TPA: hypothetical protein VFZ34_12200, partial [Blastocatellia bacterium]|nr:hypothetical protein [Blastocatellia bacterium]